MTLKPYTKTTLQYLSFGYLIEDFSEIVRIRTLIYMLTWAPSLTLAMKNLLQSLLEVSSFPLRMIGSPWFHLLILSKSDIYIYIKYIWNIILLFAIKLIWNRYFELWKWFCSVSSCPLNAAMYVQTGDLSILPLLCHYPVKVIILNSQIDFISYIISLHII